MNIVVFGAGGHGREVMSMLDEEGLAGTNFFFCESVVRKKHLQDFHVIGLEELKDFNRSNTFVHVAIGDPKARRKIVKLIANLNFDFYTVVSKRAKIARSAQIGIGSYIGDFVVISPNVIIEPFCLVNYHASISHDVTLGEFTTISPGANINGYVDISSDAFVGSNSVIINGSESKHINLGSGSVIGAGSVVIDDVEPFSTVVGNPARKI